MSGHVTGAQVKERLALVHERVDEALERSGRGGEQARVLVATKYYDWEQLAELAGLVWTSSERTVPRTC